MKKIILPFLTFLTLFLASCKKGEKPENKGSDLNGKVSTVTFAGSYGTDVTAPYTVQILYNADGSVSKSTYTYSNSQAHSTTTYKYTQGKILSTTEIFAPGSPDIIDNEEGFLNPNDKVDSMVHRSSAYSNIAATRYLYDSQGQLAHMRNYNFLPENSSVAAPVTIDTYTYENGNMVKFTSTGQPQVFTYKYSTHANNVNGAPGSILFMHTANLVTETYMQTSLLAEPELASTTSYSFDNDDRVSVETTKYFLNGVATGQVYTRTFAYY